MARKKRRSVSMHQRTYQRLQELAPALAKERGLDSDALSATVEWLIHTACEERGIPMPEVIHYETKAEPKRRQGHGGYFSF